MKTIHWAGKVSIESVLERKDELTTAFAASAAVRVDLNDCTTIDLSGLQLLCSSAVTAGKTGKELQVLMNGDSPVYSLVERGGFLRSQPCRSDCGRQCLWLAVAYQS